MGMGSRGKLEERVTMGCESEDDECEEGLESA